MTLGAFYRIIIIVSCYADRQRHVPAQSAGPMPVPIRKFRITGRCTRDEENVSAQEASALQGARLPQAYAHVERPQGVGSPPRQGPRKAERLSRSSVKAAVFIKRALPNHIRTKPLRRKALTREAFLPSCIKSQDLRLTFYENGRLFSF